MDLSAAVFFVVILSLLTLLHDRFLPVHAVRARSASPDDSGSTDQFARDDQASA
jgi:hypothetical protein